jgi:hypothetical protein
MLRRIPWLPGPIRVHLAAGLDVHPDFSKAEDILTSLREGGDMSHCVSPMRAAKKAFQEATGSGDWSRYQRMMDLLLNKWGIYHFHTDGSRLLVFVYIANSEAFVLDILPHDKNWKIERRLVEIVVRNWSNQDIVVAVGTGNSLLSEEVLLTERKRGTNMRVEVDGTFYMPRSYGLMMDGSGYDALTGIHPVAVMAKRLGEDEPGEPAVRNPHMMMVGIDPDDPHPPWAIAAEHAAMMAAHRRRITARRMAENGVGPVADAVRRVLYPRR